MVLSHLPQFPKGDEERLKLDDGRIPEAPCTGSKARFSFWLRYLLWRQAPILSSLDSTCKKPRSMTFIKPSGADRSPAEDWSSSTSIAPRLTTEWPTFW